MVITHHEVFGHDLSLLWTLLKMIGPGTIFILEIELEVKPKLKPKRDPLLKNKKFQEKNNQLIFMNMLGVKFFYSYRFKHAVRPLES